jgi:hypothetical protein
MKKNNSTKKTIQILVIAGLIIYNYLAILKIGSISDKISYIDNKIELSNYESMNIPDLLANNKKYVKYVEKITKQFEGDVEYLESLDTIKEMCKRNNISVIELTSELKNNLNATQGVFENYDRTTDRYQINLKVSGVFLNIGKLIERLLESSYFVNTLRIDRSSDSKVTGFFTLYHYLSKPLNSRDILAVNFDKAIKDTPVFDKIDLQKNINWGNDIFYKTKKITKPTLNSRAYYLTDVSLKLNPSVVINGKTYKNGSIIDVYTIKDITANSVTLSGARKSIVLQLEKGAAIQITTGGFKKAFIEARRSGQSYFEYKGKIYSTDLN